MNSGVAHEIRLGSACHATNSERAWLASVGVKGTRVADHRSFRSCVKHDDAVWRASRDATGKQHQSIVGVQRRHVLDVRPEC